MINFSCTIRNDIFVDTFCSRLNYRPQTVIKNIHVYLVLFEYFSTRLLLNVLIGSTGRKLMVLCTPLKKRLVPNYPFLWLVVDKLKKQQQQKQHNTLEIVNQEGWGICYTEYCQAGVLKMLLDIQSLDRLFISERKVSNFSFTWGCVPSMTLQIFFFV